MVIVGVAFWCFLFYEGKPLVKQNIYVIILRMTYVQEQCTVEEVLEVFEAVF